MKPTLLLVALAWGCSVEYVTIDPPPGDQSADGAAADGAQTGDGVHGDTAEGDAAHGGDTAGDTAQTGDAWVHGDAHSGDGAPAGDALCPPCAPPPSNDCVGTGPCGCGPYLCPGDSDRVCASGVSGGCPGEYDTCECCPAGGPMQNCLCTTSCETDDDCKDPSRPVCNKSSATNARGMCTDAQFFCCWMCQ